MKWYGEQLGKALYGHVLKMRTSDGYLKHESGVVEEKGESYPKKDSDHGTAPCTWIDMYNVYRDIRHFPFNGVCLQCGKSVTGELAILDRNFGDIYVVERKK